MRNQVQEQHLLWQLISVFAGSNKSINIDTTLMAAWLRSNNTGIIIPLNQMRLVKLGHGYTRQYPKSIGHSTVSGSQFSFMRNSKQFYITFLKNGF